MANYGILGGNDDTQQRGILSGLGGGGNSLGLIGAALSDVAAHLGGKPESATNLAQFQQLGQRRQLLGALTSQDPDVRAQAYQIAPALGIDPSMFQKSQASAALPRLLGAMTPKLNDNPVTVTPQVTAQDPLNDPSRMAANAGPITHLPTLSDALGTVNSPELSAQMAPEIIKQTMDNQMKAETTLTPEQATALGFKPGSIVQKDAYGNLKVAQASDLKSQGAMDQQIDLQNRNPELAISRANLDLSKQRLGMEQQRLTAGIPNDDTLHDMAERYVSGDKSAAGSLGRNPMAQTAFQNMISQVGKEQGLTPQQVSQNQQSFQAGTKAVQAFDTGPQGNTTRSLNVAIAHLDTLGKLSDALKNGDVQAFNKIGNAFATQTGNPAPTNFNAAKAIVGDEIIKAIVGGGGALADRENAQNQISAASSPQQLAGVIKTYKNLMAGQLHGLSKQYTASTGRNDFNSKLFPETISQLEAAPPPKVGPVNAANLPRLPASDPKTDALLAKYGVK